MFGATADFNTNYQMLQWCNNPNGVSGCPGDERMPALDVSYRNNLLLVSHSIVSLSVQVEVIANNSTPQPQRVTGIPMEF